MTAANPNPLPHGEPPVPAPDPVSGIVADLGIEAFKHALPTGLEYVRTRVFGKRLTVVGPADAGKTSFIEYCQFGTLSEVGEPITTREVPPGAKFVIRADPDPTGEARLELRVKRAIDLPGQYDPEFQAELLVRQRPHLAVVMVDIALEPHVAWVGKLLAEYSRLLGQDSAARNRLRSVVFVLNKVDLVGADEGRLVALRKQEVGGHRALLAAAVGSRARHFLVLPGIFAATPRGPALARRVVRVIARALAR